MVSGGHAPPAAVPGVTISMTVLAAIVACGRLYTRVRIVSKAGWDDICISLALVLTIGLTVTMCEQVQYGMGTHADTLTTSDVYYSLRWFWASVWIYYLALCFTKLSILLQYLRVFPHNGFRIACFVLMGVVIVYSICTFFSAIFECTPVAYFWNKSLDGSCLNQTAIWFANASINIVTDLATAVLPLPVLNTLQIPKREKYLLMAVFGLGGFTCLISILRLQSLYVVSHTDDISWNNPLPAIWSSTEVNVGILCSCLPTLKGLLNRLYPSLFNSTLHTYGYASRASAPIEFGNISSRPPEPHELVVGERIQELSDEEKHTARYGTYEADDKDDTANSPSRSNSHMSYYRHSKTQSIIEQDLGRRDDETIGSEGGSIHQLAPIPRSYQPM